MYNPISTTDNDVESTASGSNALPPALARAPSGSLTSHHQVPISRPPIAPRDTFFALLFLLHLSLIVFLVSYEERRMESSVRVGEIDSWASLGMVVTFLSSCIGAAILSIMTKATYREFIISLTCPAAIILEIAFGNILFLLNTDFSYIGILLLVSAAINVVWYRHSKDNIAFTSALVGAVLEINKSFHLHLLCVCLAILIVQTCFLFLWGIVTVTFLAVVSSKQTYSMLFCLVMSYLWVTLTLKFMMAFVISGAFLWYYAIDEYSTSGHVLSLSERVILSFRCVLFTSLGTVTKVAAFAPLAETILHLERWCITSRFVLPTKYSLRYFVYYAIYPFIEFAHLHNSRYLGYAAVFSLSLTKAGVDLRSHPEVAAIHAEDVSGYVLNSIGVFVASIIAIIFGVLARNKEGEEWPLFFVFCFYLSFTCISFSLHAIKSGIDAMILATVLYPSKFQAEYPIIFSRFNRLSEFEMR